MSKPYKLNDEVIEQTRDLAARFRTEYQIADALEINQETLIDWKHKAESEGGIYARWKNALDEGRDEFYANLEQRCVMRISNADAWQSDAWLLERCFPAKYGRPAARPLESDDAIAAVSNVLVKIAEAASTH